MDDAGDVSEEGEQKIQPKLHSQANLQEDTKRRNEDRKQNAKDVGITGAHADIRVGRAMQEWI